MRLLATSATCLGLFCIACAHAFAGTGIIYRHSDLASNIRTSVTLDDPTFDDLFGANFLTNAASRVPIYDSQQDARIAGTFVGNPN